MSKFAETFFFKDIFEDSDSFLKYLEEYTHLDYTDELHVKVYNYLMMRYANSNVNYNTLSSFKRLFAIDYEDYFLQYKFRKSAIEKMYDLTENDILLINKTINNIALNNNEITDSPLEKVIEYISNQQSNAIYSNKLVAYLQALQDIQDQWINELLDRFKKHFMQIFSEKVYIFKEEE